MFSEIRSFTSLGIRFFSPPVSLVIPAQVLGLSHSSEAYCPIAHTSISTGYVLMTVLYLGNVRL